MYVRHTATVQTVVPQFVHCAHCNHKFVYEMVVKGTGVVERDPLFDRAEDAKASAEAFAREQLNVALNDIELCAAIPCPSCYRYQRYMFKRLVPDRYEAFGCVGCLFTVVGALAALLAVVGLFDAAPGKRQQFVWIALGSVAAFLVGALWKVLERRWAAAYDPNTRRLEARQKKASDRGMSLAGYNELQAARAHRAYAEYVLAVRNGGARGGNPFANPEPLVIDWWAPPSVFLYGGLIEIPGANGALVTVAVPENAEPGTVFDLLLYPHGMRPFKVRVQAIRVHPEEHRLDDESPE